MWRTDNRVCPPCSARWENRTGRIASPPLAGAPHIIAAMSVQQDKQFHTECQEEVYRQVKSYLDELVDEHFDDADHCDFYLKYGSTVLEISIHPYQDDEAVIEILAFVVQGVDPSFEMAQELLRLNSE